MTEPNLICLESGYSDGTRTNSLPKDITRDRPVSSALPVTRRQLLCLPYDPRCFTSNAVWFRQRERWNSAWALPSVGALRGLPEWVPEWKVKGVPLGARVPGFSFRI